MTYFELHCILQVGCNNLRMSTKHLGRCAKGLGVRCSFFFSEGALQACKTNGFQDSLVEISETEPLTS